ncbi:MAG: hypothetical protein H7X97_07625 [Opitutaceae bacterium]|nr:hypothetical protein [Verrucomicrobiales bacterium]
MGNDTAASKHLGQRPCGAPTGIGVWHFGHKLDDEGWFILPVPEEIQGRGYTKSEFKASEMGVNVLELNANRSVNSVRLVAPFIGKIADSQTFSVRYRNRERRFWSVWVMADAPEIPR